MDINALQKSLAKDLGKGKMSAGDLKAISKSLANTGKDIKFEKWWWVGQPVPDRFVIQGRLNADRLRIIAELVKLKSIGDIKIFPKGIPIPDVVDIQINLDLQR